MEYWLDISIFKCNFQEAIISRISRFPGLNLGSFASYEGVHSFRSQNKTDTRSYEEDECTALNEELRVPSFRRHYRIEERELATTKPV